MDDWWFKVVLMCEWLLASAPVGEGGAAISPGGYWTAVVVIGLLLLIRELMR